MRSLRWLLMAQFMGVVLVAGLVTALLVGLWRQPVANEFARQERTRVADLALQQLENTLDSAEALLHSLAQLVDEDGRGGAAPAAGLEHLFQRLAGPDALFEGLYLLDQAGRVRALGIARSAGTPEAEAHGHDLSGLAVLGHARTLGRMHWSEKLLSPLQGRPVVALAAPLAGGTLLAEVSVARLARVVLKAGRVDGLLVLVVDGKGEVVAAPDMRLADSRANIGHLGIVRNALGGEPSHGRFEHERQRYVGTALPSQRLGWAVLIGYPQAVAEAPERAAIVIATTTLGLSLLAGLVTTHWLARLLGRRVERSIAYAREVADGNYQAAMEPARITELERLNQGLHRMAQKIQRREQQLRAVLDSTPSVAIQILDAAGQVLDWNPASQALFGWTRAEALGRPLDELILPPGQDRDFATTLRERVSGAHAAESVEGQAHTRSGQALTLLTTTFEVPGDTDAPMFVCMHIDITRLKRQEAEIRASERRFNSFFNASPVAMAVGRLQGRQFQHLDVNQAWLTLMRYQRDTVLAAAPGEIRLAVDGPGARDLADLLDLALDTPAPQPSVEITLRRGDGSSFLAEGTMRPLDVGEDHLVIYALHDITDKRALERELLDLNAALENRIEQRTASLTQTNAELQQALSRLQRAQDRLVQTEKLASLGSLVAGVAHELNTPIGNGLMAITTLHERLQHFQQQLHAGLRRSELQSFIATVDEACAIGTHNLGRASALLGSFKQVAVDQTSEQRRTFDLAELVDEIVLTLQPTWRRRGLEVVRELEPGLQMDSYPGALGQVLTNLIQNAVLHGLDGQDKATLRLQASAHGDDVLLSVADNGRGIPESLHKRVFEPFFTTRLGHGGSGLGLPIVHNIVSSTLGGQIELISRPGEGTRFELLLPRHAPQRATA